MWIVVTKVVKKIVIAVTIATSIICIGTLNSGLKDIQLNKLVKVIQQQHMTEENIDEKLFKRVVEEITQKEQLQEVFREKEYFILGYGYYLRGDIDLALQNFKLCNELITAKTDTFIKIYTGNILMQMLIEEEKYDEAVSNVASVLQNITVKEFGERYSEVIPLIGGILYIPGGREVGIDKLEQVLQDKNRLTVEEICDVKNKLSVMYLHNGNYAKGIEKCLEVIAMKDEVDNKYYVAKACIDLGVLYGSLGDKELSKVSIEKGLEVEIENQSSDALIKSYGLINLYASIREGEYDRLIEVSNKVEEYSSLLDEDVLKSIGLINNCMLVQCYIEQGDLEKAEELFEEVEKLYSELIDPMLADVAIFYYSARADLMQVKANMQEAIKDYNKVLEECEKNGNPSAAKGTLIALIDIFNEAGEYELANTYDKKLLALLQREAILVNRDYAEYALYKYEFKTRQMEMATEEVRRYILTYVSIVIGIIMMVITYMKYTTLKKLHRIDGLTKVYNRNYFNECYKILLEGNRPFKLVMVDVDNFKEINDKYGHIYGDEVIKRVAGLCQGAIGDRGKVYRYGGEEFVIVLEGVLMKEALEMSEQMRVSVENDKWYKEEKITISLGVAQTSHILRDILEEADQNLYKSKTTGKNKVTY